VQSERAVQAVQRIDEHAHGHAARRGCGQRRFHGLADVVIDRHVHLEVHAVLTAVDGLEQPVARLRVVQFHLDAIASNRFAARGRIEQ